MAISMLNLETMVGAKKYLEILRIKPIHDFGKSHPNTLNNFVTYKDFTIKFSVANGEFTVSCKNDLATDEPLEISARISAKTIHGSSFIVPCIDKIVEFINIRYDE